MKTRDKAASGQPSQAKSMDDQEKDPEKRPENPDPVTDEESNVSPAEREDLENAANGTFDEETRKQDADPRLEANEDHPGPGREGTTDKEAGGYGVAGHPPVPDQ